MTVFELLGIKSGDAIKVDNPRSTSGPREVVPLGLSKNNISIRVIDCRYGDIRYVNADWKVFLSSGEVIQLQDFPYIKQRLNEWNSRNERIKSAYSKVKKEFEFEEYKREYASLDEILDTIDLSDLKVAITGKLPFPRSKIKSIFEEKGAIVVDSINGETAFLFMGNTGKYEITAKMKKALGLGVKIITL